jgi:hypothetical protein
MEPITATAIVAAIAAGVAKSAASVGEKLLVDGYAALKALLQRRFGGASKVVKAVDDLETTPSSEGRKLIVREELQEAKVDDDPEIRRAAQSLLDQLKAQPGGQQHIQNAIGSFIAQADRHSTAQVRVNQPNEPNESRQQQPNRPTP